ncbi:MAG: hypothetical protein QOF84_4485 [Streptomyces sp.]|jgi:uncharacterized protein YukE|nr:hypothetical protein [Streptomyces sp.]MDX6349695.1 hypothetical protein [Streptomyces sp.]
MNFLSEAWHDGEQLVGDAVQVGRDIVMAPVEIAHWALEKMFGSTEDLGRIASELAALGKQIDQLSKDIDTAVGQVDWHGEAADAFQSHAQGRIRELRSAADGLGALSESVQRLGNVL